MGFILGVALGVVLAVAALFGWVDSGRWNVAADAPPPVWERWLYGTGARQSIKVAAKGVEVPQFDAAMVEDGARSFHASCESCHGAPGAEPGEVGKGLAPKPTDLATTAPQWAPAELFWIVKHGMRATGMPAFGPSRVDGELWPVVAFMAELPKMTPERYGELSRPPQPPAPAPAAEAPPTDVIPPSEGEPPAAGTAPPETTQQSEPPAPGQLAPQQSTPEQPVPQQPAQVPQPGEQVQPPRE
jgi:mono/diheme cytochrome c family protein